MTYQLRGDADPEHIGRLASYVDRKMQVLEESARAQSPARLAVLASLTIADEYFQEKEAHDAIHDRVKARAARLETLLDEVLDEGGPES